MLQINLIVFLFNLFLALVCCADVKPDFSEANSQEVTTTKCLFILTEKMENVCKQSLIETIA